MCLNISKELKLNSQQELYTDIQYYYGFLKLVMWGIESNHNI